MKEYKSSKYNVIVKETEDKVVIWNSFNGAIIELEKKVYEQIKNDTFNDNVSYFNELLDMGLILDAEIDEYEMVKKKEQEIINKENENMSIVITPTLKCNFKCVYCFEAHKEKKKVMEKQTYEKILKYIKNKCVESNIKNLVITWFGGEPMLCYDAMQDLGEKIKKFAEEKGINFITRIITNGSLLSKEKVSILKEKMNLKLLQITLDGLEDVYIEKKGTTREAFRKVIDNICNLCEIVKIKVRINADKSNYNDLLKLVDFLLIEKNLKSKVDIYFAELKNYNNDENQNFYSINEGIKARFNFYEDLHKKELIKKRNIAPISFDPLFCGFKNKNNIVIGPDGEIYKCQHDIGEYCKIMGDMENGLTNVEGLNKFYNFCNSEVCKKCNLYPVCRHNACPELNKMVVYENESCNIYNDFLESIKFQCEKYLENQ